VWRTTLARIAKEIDRDKIHLIRTFTNTDYLVTLDNYLAIESVENILNNAIWAIQHNSLSSKRQLLIAVRADAESKYVKLVLEDSGVGMDPDTLSKVARFESFGSYRAGGTGLGLYFARNLINHFGGTMAITRSQIGKGTTIEITLPIRSISHEA
jgi:signal transduction histidine kinase